MEPEQADLLWLLIVGFIIAFVLAFGIGANDVANSFGTSVGSKVLTLFQACIIASIFELAGAVLIGSKVSDTVRKGIIDINSFNGTEKYAMAGAFSALTGTSIWLIVATFFNLPVSGTHSIVGATIGYALVALGPDGVTWKTLGKIAASWVISPLLSGIVSSLIFFGIDRLILRTKNPLKNGLISLPILFAATMFINMFSILDSGKTVFGMAHFKWYTILGICAGVSLVLASLCFFFVNPFLKKKILREHDKKNATSAKFQKFDDSVAVHGTKYERKIDDVKDVCADMQQLLTNDDGAADNKGVCEEGKEEKDSSSKQNNVSCVQNNRDRSVSVLSEIMKPADDVIVVNQDDPHTAHLFKYLQILTAAFGAFSHGGNDVSNAIGPVISLWIIFKTGMVIGKTATPIWILLYGGAGIIVGLCVWGRRVIKTIGENLSPITPTSGFAIEIGSALTVLLASFLGIPVSTTHCKVGSVVMVGRLRSKEVVNWSLFGNIVLSWIVTMPITGGISAAIFAILREVI